ncbi:MAG: AI-2E family transporter [Calditrichia bacterium]|nr:AI-2E family transporter [Calditrichia bacterium]
MLLDQKPYTLDRIVRLGMFVALIWGIVWILGYLSDVLIPFFVAFLLAYLINPLVSLVQKKIHNRGLAIFISLLGVLLCVGLFIVLIVPLMAGEITHMGEIITNLMNNSELAEKAAEKLPPDLWKSIRDYAMQDEVRQFFKTENFWKITQSIAQKILPGVWGIISGTASFLWSLAGLMIIGLYLVFLLIDFHKVNTGWKELLPDAYVEKISAFTIEFNEAMRRYFRAQAAIAAIVGVLFAVGFEIIGLPLGIFLGLFIGLLNMVPYLQIIGLIPASLLAGVHAIDTGMSFWLVLGLTMLVFVVVQIIQDAVLVPRIMGKVTGLSPAIILLSLSVWGKLLGMLGLLIALPMTSLIIAYYKHYLEKVWKKHNEEDKGVLT